MQLTDMPVDAEGGDPDPCALPSIWLPFPLRLPQRRAALCRLSAAGATELLLLSSAESGGLGWVGVRVLTANHTFLCKYEGDTCASVQEETVGISRACTHKWACCLGGRQAGTKGDAEGSCSCKAGFGVLICSFFSCSLGNFKGLCKQIDHFPEDADYEADTAEYFLRKSTGSFCNGS